MKEVKLGLERGIDAKLYAKVKYDWPHMKANSAMLRTKSRRIANAQCVVTLLASV